jgi:hypothetical protein
MPGGASGMTAGGATGTYDGGGIAMGGASPCPGTTTAQGGSVPSSTPLTPSPGGATRTGIPLGSYEIGNAGISGVPAVPTPSPTPSNTLPGSSICNGSTPGNPAQSPMSPGGGAPGASGTYPGIC